MVVRLTGNCKLHFVTYWQLHFVGIIVNLFSEIGGIIVNNPKGTRQDGWQDYWQMLTSHIVGGIIVSDGPGGLDTDTWQTWYV